MEQPRKEQPPLHLMVVQTAVAAYKNTRITYKTVQNHRNWLRPTSLTEFVAKLKPKQVPTSPKTNSTDRAVQGKQ